MKRSVAILTALAACMLGRTAQAEEGRFDAQVFRPSPAPRDLVMVQKSEVIADRSPTIGVFLHYSLNPLALLLKEKGQTIDAVASRFELVGLAGLGLFDWVDFTLAMPLVLYQSSDNLRPLGTEGSIPPTGLGDLRIGTKVALPFLNRKDQIKKGFGMAVTGNVNVPTGDQNAFTSDGNITGGVGLVADYRFKFGLLVATNAGVWFRPDREFAGVRIGNMGSFGVAAEMNIIQRWGISVIGEVYGHASLTKYPDSPAQIPVETLLGARWQSKHGVTITIGGAFGADCGFGAPAFRFFSGITFQPSTSREQEEIIRLQQRDMDDPDGDGMIGKADRCPDAPGSPLNMGCPDTDMDKDGWVDREDECPDEPAGPHGKKGCPIAHIKGDEIVILDQVHFATDKDIILEESKPILEAVAQVLIGHPEIRSVEIEGHTDVRATDTYNMGLSQRRVNSVMKYLIDDQGIDPSRLKATGYGHSKPLFDDAGCLGPDDGLTESCKVMTSKNRRVVFHITRVGVAGSKPITGAPDGSATVLPGRETVLPKATTLPSRGALPETGVLKENSALGEERVLPGSSGEGSLPKSVLPRSGTARPKDKEENKEAPVKPPAKP